MPSIKGDLIIANSISRSNFQQSYSRTARAVRMTALKGLDQGIPASL
jgi:hypothetical protein